jgi:CheY-like chemotaxis protein
LGASGDGQVACRILVVDDDHGIRESLRTLLELEGYEVELAEDGVQALLILETYPVQLILLDMRMPRMDGWAFVRQARALGITTEAIACSARARP